MVEADWNEEVIEDRVESQNWIQFQFIQDEDEEEEVFIEEIGEEEWIEFIEEMINLDFSDDLAIKIRNELEKIDYHPEDFLRDLTEQEYDGNDFKDLSATEIVVMVSVPLENVN